ncbi:hypothetical protein ACLQ3C_21380, partial [Gordonia sp. DT30]|uniref:hypothetical protein n=1 Tax=unclassified Gordonia (in: high G+C Gram-positive bacteria) TaxID=2657482 RepID=UPI003CFAF7DB
MLHTIDRLPRIRLSPDHRITGILTPGRSLLHAILVHTSARTLITPNTRPLRRPTCRTIQVPGPIEVPSPIEVVRLPHSTRALPRTLVFLLGPPTTAFRSSLFGSGIPPARPATIVAVPTRTGPPSIPVLTTLLARSVLTRPVPTRP